MSVVTGAGGALGTAICRQLASEPDTALVVSDVAELDTPYTWCHSYVAGDKIYCVYEAESAEACLEHARIGGFPANLVSEIVNVFDANGLRGVPA